jgi:hypothetical protein
MLNPITLQQQIQGALRPLSVAIEQSFSRLFPLQTKRDKEVLAAIKADFEKLVMIQVSTMLAYAIDSYIKNISVSGMILTKGGPHSQAALVTSSPLGQGGGVEPNNLLIM